MDITKFLQLDVDEVASLVHKNGPRVVVCPINGTRRWFMLESRKQEQESDFLEIILDRYTEIFELFFSHGIPTLLTPILGPDIIQRGEDYTRMVFAALNEITTGEKFRSFYKAHDVRVRFYGDYHAYFKQEAPEVLEKLAGIQAETRDHLEHKLLWGMFAEDASEQIARIAIDYHSKNGGVPKRNEIVSRYFGEYLPPADVFIGMMPPSVFDFPLLDSGNTSLYFTTAPTPYLNEEMLRCILYDYLYVRTVRDDYQNVSIASWDDLESFYEKHKTDVFGLGKKIAGGSVWLPMPPGN